MTVTAGGAGEPVSGGRVTFTPPVSGASATIAGTPALISGSTATTGIVTANATSGGPYSVAASAKGVTTALSFSLTNTAAVLASAALLNSEISSGGGQSVIHVEGKGGKAARTVRANGDFDGDGKSDLAVWRGELSQWQIIHSSTGEMQTAQLGASSSPSEDVPVTGDFDSDKKTDIAVFRRGGTEAGHWFILRSSDSEVANVYFGLGNDVPVPADYDGDGKTDIAVWRGSENRWYIAQSSDNQIAVVWCGSDAATNQDVPVPADYDGDGKVDVAVFRPASSLGDSVGHWYIRPQFGRHAGG